MKANKIAKKKIYKIVCPDVEKETYDRIKQLAADEKRTIGKQTEYLAEMAINNLYNNK